MNVKAEAADLLDAMALSVASGWGQGRSFDGERGALYPVCAIGHACAITEEAALSHNTYFEAFRALNRQVRGGIQHWNDQSERTQDDVIAVCHRVAHRLRREVADETPEGEEEGGL